jgi:hypothetical protein
VIEIIAVLCSLASPANCREQIVTTSDFAEVSMQSCLMGAPQLAEWMKGVSAEGIFSSCSGATPENPEPGDKCEERDL